MKISKKKCDDLVIHYNRTRKIKLIHVKKRKIVIPQEFEETESERLDKEIKKKKKLKNKAMQTK